MSEPILPIRRVAIDTWRENVVFLHRECPVVRAAGFQALAKVRVQVNGKTLIAVLNMVGDECICPPLELGLSEEAFRRLGVEPGHPARIEQAEPPPSIAALHRKIAGEPHLEGAGHAGAVHRGDRRLGRAPEPHRDRKDRQDYARMLRTLAEVGRITASATLVTFWDVTVSGCG